MQDINREDLQSIPKLANRREKGMKKLILLFPTMIVLAMIVLAILNSGYGEAQHPADSNHIALLGHNDLQALRPISR